MSTILELANADRNLSTMMKTLKDTEFQSELTGLGPYTILAPVNLAFGKLTPMSIEELSKPKNTGKLSNILGNHILKEKKLLKDFYNGQKLRTINGNELNVSVTNEEVRINGALILSRDRQGSNGVVHSIDAVNVPLS
jgi:uncharacterized surface protein with fasciclin (FAS1) repeats